MSICDYCGRKAGWFQSSHPACLAKANSTAQAVKDLVFNGTMAGKSYDELSTDVEKILADQTVQFKYVREALLQGINDAASHLALQSPLSDQEFYRLHHILGTHGFDIYAYQAEFASRRWFSVPQCLMSSILWEVLHRRIGPFDGPIEFNLRSGEIPIFQTPNCVTYSEERTISNYARRFSGLSVPIGGGIYYHFGGSQGHPERTVGLVQLDAGKVLITSQALYFGGQTTTLRIPLQSVLRYQPYVDGVAVCESHGTPKVFVFHYRGMDTGWFFYNVLSAITRNLTQEG